jgi:hypothetical protein
MKFEFRSFLVIGSACSAIALAAHHQRPECESAMDFWCEMEAPRLKDGHEKEPAPTRLPQQASTSDTGTLMSATSNLPPPR